MAHEFFNPHASMAESQSIEERVRTGIAAMAAQCGITGEADIDQAVEREFSRKLAKGVLDSLESEGVKLAGARLLDSGAGFGMLAVEAASRGVIVTAAEPGAECCAIAAERLRPFPTSRAVEASGESLPFADQSFDIVTSLQVLEHVQSPRKYLQEAFRVLKPGGILYLSAENYLAFYEGHYRMWWFPLMPKPLAALYLRLRGRPTRFLQRSITYITRPGVARLLRSCGFVSLRERRVAAKVAATKVLTPARIVLGERLVARAIIAAQNSRTTFSRGLYAVVQRPPLPSE